MKIEVNLEKKYLFFVFAILLIFAGFVLVFAYNPSFSGGNPPVLGHSADEVNVQIGNTVRTSQDLIDNFYGKAECVINSTELKTKGCPSKSYLHKVNVNANSSCKQFYTNYTVNPAQWCYFGDHLTTPPSGSTTHPICGICSQIESGQVCCVVGLICAYDRYSDVWRWMRPSLPVVCQ